MAQHGVGLVPTLEANAVWRRATRERAGHGDLAVAVEMDEVLPRERLERSLGVQPEPHGRLAYLGAAGRPLVANRRRIQK